MKTQNLKIFLSYGHDQNAELVKIIKEDLEKRGHDVWFDKHKIKAGDDWRRQITDGLSESDKVLSFLSKHSTRDPGVCRDEIAIAIGVKGGNIQTILLEPENEVEPPVNIGHIQWLDMHEWKTCFAQGGETWQTWYKEKLSEIIRVIESDESKRFAGEIEKLNRCLKPIQSYARINELLNRGFFGREWLFEKIDDWQKEYSNNSRVFVLLANAGVGKSAFAAHLAHRQGDVVVAAHFCEWNKPDHSDAIATVKSIAFQLATKFPDYRKYLLTLPDIEKIEQRKAAELFTYLVANPLSFCIHGGRPRYMILIDAIDEANSKNNENEIIALIADEFGRTPSWLSLVVTSRPENDVLARLSKFNPRYIDARDESNLADIHLFLQNRLAGYEPSQKNKAIESIRQKCEGNFLYAVEICNDIHSGIVDINKPEQFPAGMGNLYINSFARKFSDVDYNTRIAPVLEILCTAMESISTNHVCRLLDLKGRELNEVLQKAGSFFPVTEGKIKPFHKSLIDWLYNSQTSGLFYIAQHDAEKNMAEAHNQVIEELLADADAFEDTDEYALKYALVHMYKAGSKKQLQQRLLQIFDADEFVYTACEPLLNNLTDWVVKNNSATDEQLLKKALQKVSDETNNKERLDDFFYNQGNAYQNNGFSSWALDFFEKSMKVREKLVSLEPGRTDFRYRLSVSLNDVGNIYSEMGEGPKALEFFKKSLKIREELVSLEPGRTDFKYYLSISLNNIGYMYSKMGESTKALEFHEKSLKLLEELVTLEPGRTHIRRDLSMSFNNVGYMYSKMGESAKTLEYYEKSLKIMEELISLESGRTDFRREIGSIFNNFGNMYKMMGEGAKALEFYEKSLKIREELVSLEHERTDFRSKLSISFSIVGIMYKEMGEGAKALEFYEKSLKIMEELVSLEPGRTDFRRELSSIFNNFGKIYIAMGESAKALEFHEKSLKIMEELVSLEPGRTDFSRDLSMSCNNVGNMYKEMGENAKALEFFEKSLKIMEELVSLEHGRTDFRFDYAVRHWNFYSISQPEDKMQWLEKAKAILEELINEGAKHSQLEELWNKVNEAIVSECNN